MQYVKAAAQITLEKAQERAQSELKYGCSDEELEPSYTYVYVLFLHGIAQIPVGKAQNEAQNELKQTHIGHQDAPRYMQYVKAAAQITLEKAQDRAQSELKYRCSDEEQQQRHTYVYVCFCSAWDSSNSNGESSKSSSKWAQTNTYKTQRYLEYVKVAAQITLEKAQDRAQNELKYRCRDEELQPSYTYVYFFCMGQLKFQWGKLKMKLRQTRIGYQDASRYMQYVKAAAQITLEKAQDRAQSELKYRCSDEEHQQRYTYVYVCVFVHRIAQILVGKAQNELKQTYIGHQDASIYMQYVKAAAEITLEKVQDRAQNELKYRCSDEELQPS